MESSRLSSPGGLHASSTGKTVLLLPSSIMNIRYSVLYSILLSVWIALFRHFPISVPISSLLLCNVHFHQTLRTFLDEANALRANICYAVDLVSCHDLTKN